MLKWLQAEGWCAFGNHTCEGAAIAGRLAALQHLRIEGCSWHEHIASQAASGGSIEVLAWLQQQPGIVVNAGVMATAARYGQTALCEFLHNTGCEWDAGACSGATTRHYFDTLRWLLEHGCPYDVSQVCISAARGGCTDLLDYVLEQGEVLSAELLTRASNCAGAHGHLLAAQWLRQHGAAWPAELVGEFEYTKPWSDAMLAWARAEGCTTPVAVYACIAFRYDNIALLLLLPLLPLRWSLLLLVSLPCL
jgi:hypothetical protein